MAGKNGLAMAGVCALLLLAFLASDVSAQCSLGEMSHCIVAVTNGENPSRPCCLQVSRIYDFNCFCNILLSQRNVRPDYINNALLVPLKCGSLGANLRNKQCGKYRTP